jgi:hypothetical protein
VWSDGRTGARDDRCATGATTFPRRRNADLLADTLLLPTGLLTAVYLTRRLGATDYGLFALLLSVVFWGEGILAAAMNRATIKFIADLADWRQVGAALACPDRRVIAFHADGSGLYTLQALWSMAPALYERIVRGGPSRRRARRPALLRAPLAYVQSLFHGVSLPTLDTNLT